MFEEKIITIDNVIYSFEIFKRDEHIMVIVCNKTNSTSNLILSTTGLEYNDVKLIIDEIKPIRFQALLCNRLLSRKAIFEKLFDWDRFYEILNRGYMEGYITK